MANGPDHGLVFGGALGDVAAKDANVAGAQLLSHVEPLANCFDGAGLQLRRGLRHVGANADGVDRDA